MFLEKSRAQIATLQFLKKGGFYIAVLSVSSSQQPGQSRCCQHACASANPAVTQLAT